MTSRPQYDREGQQTQLTPRQRALLDTVFGFKENAPIKAFIQDVTQSTAEHYTLAEILENLKKVITEERLFDESNPSIVMCSEQLERVFNQKALHVRQVKSAVLSQLVQREIPPIQDNQDDFATPDETRKIASMETDSPTYIISTPLRKVFETMEEYDQARVSFKYHEITDLLSNYIIRNQDRLFDQRNIHVALVENDLLGKALQVKSFHRCQIQALLRTQLTPVPTPSHLHEITQTQDGRHEHHIRPIITSDASHNIAASTTSMHNMTLQDPDE